MPGWHCVWVGSGCLASVTLTEPRQGAEKVLLFTASRSERGSSDNNGL